MKPWVVSLLCAIAVACDAPARAPEGDSAIGGDFADACMPEGYDRDRLAALRTSEFRFADEGERAGFALAIVECLASPDPYLRDSIAYEALAGLIRRAELGAADLLVLRDALYAKLDGTDPEGVAAPFAALVLSEVARTDRVGAWMSVHERGAMIGRAVSYVSGVNDYRGYVEGEGWRHGVAHGADWLLQLALNENVSIEQQREILRAVAAQVSPTGHSYIFGESDRLARVALFMASRSRLGSEEWAAWVEGVSQVRHVGDWSDVFFSEAGLAHRHNVRAFLSALLVGSEIGEAAGPTPLVDPVRAALGRIP